MFDYRKLSVPERILLAEDIWDSIAADNSVTEEAPLPNWQKSELEKRLQERAKKPKKGSPWRDILNKLESSL